MKKVLTAIAVIVVAAFIMLIPELIHNDFNFAKVDWQNVVVGSLIVDVSVYLAMVYANKNKKDKEENKDEK